MRNIQPTKISRTLGLATSAMCILLLSTVAVAGPNETKTPVQTDTRPQLDKFKIDGVLTSRFGKAKDPFNNKATRNHHGVDFKAPLGTPIYAPADAIISEATSLYNNSPNYGKVVIFQTDNGTKTMMAHLDSYDVQTGERVTKGQKIAEIGSTGKSTGPHVHIETRRNGVRVDPMSVWQFGK